MKNVTQNEITRITPDINLGLNSNQVNERINAKLVNSVKKQYSKSYLSIFTSNILTFFNLLGILVCIALAIIKSPISNFFFVLIYLANIFIGIIQEIRAKICIDKLSLLAQKTTKVLRDGKIQDINSNEIVLDDVILLGIGSQIPTDSIILEGEVEVNEALLTGESVPVKKRIGDNLLAGSFIVSGTCKVKADKVGKDNYVEQLSQKAKKYKKPQSELMGSLKLIIKVVGFIIVPITVAFLIKSLVIMGETDWQNTISKTSTFVIGMIPSGMFLLTSVALAVGVIKLYKHNTLVQDLYSLEMLARVDTICFDKTGTITDGRMTVNELIEIVKTDEYNVKEVVASMLSALQDNNQTAVAMQNYFGFSTKYVAEKTIPFSSKRKYSAVSFNNFGTFIYGAPEFVLNSEEYKKIEPMVNQFTSLGLRVLLLARSNESINEEKIPSNPSPIGLIIISDNIREDAIETIKWFKENNVEVKVISGDNPITVSEVSKRVGIDNADKYISLEGLTDNEALEVATKYTVFGRVSPEQKAILIKALKLAGHVTAMTGDGVNDILALKEADCAITVASGSEATRNISHLVLMDNNFNSLPKVVYEGRRVINNIQSSASLYLMKTLFTMFLAILILAVPNLITYPFVLSQMIMLEVFIIGFPSFFLSLQANDAKVEGKFITQVLSKSLPSALLMFLGVVLIDLSKLILGVDGVFTEQVYTTMKVYAFTFAGLINLFHICKPFNKFRTILFALTAICILAITVIAVIFGFPLLTLTKMWPLISPNFWHHVLIVVFVIAVEGILAPWLKKLCTKIKIPDKSFNKIK
ncbi:MAG: HAD-IC family P-type ATPase [Clostridia bacterium]|nr:HAD-IC family P-type ATPase [Clostridia bacterium]